VSGVCRSLSQRFVFVDSRLSPQDQLSFLEGKLVDIEDAESGDRPVSQAA
jgi:hypothetical protein